jgi:flagellar hook-associated protein 1 FlgK
MVDLMDIGRGGVLAYRTALGVTGENIANVDTAGYRRRDAVMQEVGVGGGVDVVDIRRAFDGLLAARSRDAQSTLGAAETHLSHVQALEDRLLPGEGGLPDLLDGFFDALDGLSQVPEDQGLRQAVLSSGAALAGGVADLAEGIDVLARNVREETEQTVARANTVLSGLAEVQEQLAQVTDERARNPLLDQRDRLLVNLAELVSIDVSLDDAGRATVRLGADGSGPLVLERGRAGRIEQGTGGRYLVTSADTKPVEVQTTLRGGMLGGLASAAGAMAQAGVDLDRWASRMAEEFNAVHAQGLTPSGGRGGALFSVSGWEAAPGALMRGTGAASVTITDATVMPAGPLTLVQDAPTGLWQARDAAGQILATGEQTLSLPGLRIEMSGVPLDGDRITLTRQDASARHMTLVLNDPQGIAAAGTLTVSAVPGNRGTATLSATVLSAPDSGPRDLSGILSAEPVEFLSAGVVGVIPAGRAGAALSVQPRFAAMDLGPLAGAAPQALSLTTPEGVAQFALPAGLSPEGLAAALNSGAVQTAEGQSLGALGLMAEAIGDTLSLLARDGDLPLSASLATDLGSLAGVVVADAAPAAVLSVFTRDGRQLSGPPLGASAAAALLTPENGFYPDAAYNADYLDGAAPYGGLSLTRQSVSGDHVALLGQAGGIATWTGTSPAPANPSVEIGYEGATQSSTLRLPEGANAAWAAQELTTALPVRAEAETRLALDVPTSGVLSFQLVGQNLTPLTIAADLGAVGAAGLQAAINAQSGATGIRAELAPNGGRLVLVEANGADISLSRVAHSGAEAVTLTRLAPDGAALGAVSLGAGGPDAARISGTVRLSGGAGFGVTENGILQTAEPDGFANGLIARQTGAAGAQVTLTPAEPGPGDQSLRRISVTGADGRVVTAEADPALGTGAAMARALAADLRATAPASRITGAALTALPPEGAQMRVSLGAQDYAIRMSGGAPVVSGPEAGRVTARFDENNRLILETEGGTLDGSALRLPGDAGEAARFGMGQGNAPVTTVIGQPFDAGSLPSSFTIKLNGQEHFVSVSAGAVVLPATFPGTGHINTAFGRVEIQFSALDGEMLIDAQPGAAAAGFETLGLRAEVTEGGALRLTATDDRVLAVESVASGGGSVLRLKDIPDEDLIVVMGGTGALRLAGEVSDTPAAERAREVRVLDAATGLVGLFDSASGAHLASRTLDAAGTARFGDLEVTLGGGRVTGDRYLLSPNSGGAGDGRSIETLANLRQRDGLTGRGGYATGFASLQQRAGAQVTASESRVATALAEAESAARAESELGGVDLDAEAARLMQQQQAYQANAQVLAVARSLFDTLLQAI